jgi:hypothetical protein
MTPCSHLGRRLYRIIFDGGFHVREICPNCGANISGHGINVPHGQVVDPETLPIWRDLRKGTGQDQPVLFDGM